MKTKWTFFPSFILGVMVSVLIAVVVNMHLAVTDPIGVAKDAQFNRADIRARITECQAELPRNQICKPVLYLEIADRKE